MVMPDIDEIYYEERVDDGAKRKTGHFKNRAFTEKGNYFREAHHDD
jgi:hypothetical protein